jgi:hypothetical protein
MARVQGGTLGYSRGGGQGFGWGTTLVRRLWGLGVELGMGFAGVWLSILGRSGVSGDRFSMFGVKRLESVVKNSTTIG